MSKAVRLPGIKPGVGWFQIPVGMTVAGLGVTPDPPGVLGCFAFLVHCSSGTATLGLPGTTPARTAVLGFSVDAGASGAFGGGAMIAVFVFKTICIPSSSSLSLSLSLSLLFLLSLSSVVCSPPPSALGAAVSSAFVAITSSSCPSCSAAPPSSGASPSSADISCFCVSSSFSSSAKPPET
jgi:hypothetical protein